MDLLAACCLDPQGEAFCLDPKGAACGCLWLIHRLWLDHLLWLVVSSRSCAAMVLGLRL
jgi:hypothetical protein